VCFSLQPDLAEAVLRGCCLLVRKGSSRPGPSYVFRAALLHAGLLRHLACFNPSTAIQIGVCFFVGRCIRSHL
jgi:hypothetical protein